MENCKVPIDRGKGKERGGREGCGKAEWRRLQGEGVEEAAVRDASQI
jgi:hypothetical protein